MPTETQHLEQRVAALQSDLNARDQPLEDTATENNERELSRGGERFERRVLSTTASGIQSPICSLPHPRG